jgi:mono/diheme cytochrome c family protein
MFRIVAPSLVSFAVVCSLVLGSGCDGVMFGDTKPSSSQAPAEDETSAGAKAVKARRCGGCHSSPLGTLAGNGAAANLTPDQKTGLGGWKDEDIVNAIRLGIDDEQNTLCSSMPRAPDMSDEEAASIVAYLKALPAVSHETEEASCTVSAQDAARHGKVVVEAQHCAACHEDDFGGSDGSGGGTVFASNITPDKATGIGSWTKEQTAAAITSGIGDEDNTLCSQMPRFANLTKDEVTGVVEYLATVAAVNRKTPKSSCASEMPDPVTEGKAFSTNRRCNGCHGANLGGKASCNPGDASNLTPTNLASWSDQQIIVAMRTGVDDEGEMLSSKMPRFPTMGDDEAKAIVAYLRSVPKVVRAGCAADGDVRDAGTTMPPVLDAGVVVIVDAGTPPQPMDAGVVIIVDAGVPVVDAGVVCSGSPVVISQVYGGGGNVNAVFSGDFVELHNRRAAAVDLSGWAIQYASASGTSWSSQLSKLPAGTQIVGGGYLLIALGPTGKNGVSLPVTALVPSKLIDMSATGGKVALTRDGESLVGGCPTSAALADFIGYGTASCAEGDSAAPSLSSVLAASRLALTGAETACVDSNVNASDFAKVTPLLHGSQLNVCQCN